MTRPFIMHAAASIRATFRSLMRIQEQSVAHCAVSIDPRELPDYLQRDIGILDGNPAWERASAAHKHEADHRKSWNDLIVTPHGA